MLEKVFELCTSFENEASPPTDTPNPDQLADKLAETLDSELEVIVCIYTSTSREIPFLCPET